MNDQPVDPELGNNNSMPESIGSFNLRGPTSGSGVSKRLRFVLVALVSLIAIAAIALVTVLLVPRGTTESGSTGEATALPTASSTAGSATTPSSTPTESPSSAPTPNVVAFTMPSCQEMRTSQMSEQISAGKWLESTVDEVGHLIENLPGPAAVNAIQAATRVRQCHWYIPNSDGIVSIGVAELSDSDWSILEGKLIADGWAATKIGPASGYEGVWDEPTLNSSETRWVYLRLGQAWLLMGPEAKDEVLIQAAAAILAANPG